MNKTEQEEVMEEMKKRHSFPEAFGFFERAIILTYKEEKK